MPLTLITTPGAADANSYADLDEAAAYNESRLYADAWADFDNKEAALIMATRLLDGLVIWTGAAASATQSLCWPRSGMLSRNGFAIPNDEIPTELKEACAEYARQLTVKDFSADDDVIVSGIQSLRAGSVSLSFKDRSADAQKLIGLYPDVTSLRNIPDAVIYLLVPSWYTRAVQEGSVPSFFKVIG